jgi:biopolymer transport protein TolQ
MGSLFSGNSLWQLFSQADLMTWIVLGLLLGMSIVCWTIFLYKIIIWRTRCSQLKDAVAKLKGAKSLEDVLHTASKFTNTLAGYFLSKSLSALKSLLMTERGGKTELDDREWEILLHSLNQILDAVIEREQSYLPVLSVSAQVATLLGLFGTIWGLMQSFLEISMQHAADITVIAPGIAEALTTTLAGLMVAIPALVMHHILHSRLGAIERQCVVLSDRFVSLSEKLFNAYQEQE